MPPCSRGLGTAFCWLRPGWCTNGGAVSSPLSLTVADLKTMPRKTLTVVHPHDKKTEKYEGVALEEILHKAGVPQGEALRGPAMATYVVAEGADGYRVVFPLAELDSGIQFRQRENHAITIRTFRHYIRSHRRPAQRFALRHSSFVQYFFQRHAFVFFCFLIVWMYDCQRFSRHRFQICNGQ